MNRYQAVKRQKRTEGYLRVELMERLILVGGGAKCTLVLLGEWGLGLARKGEVHVLA